MMTKIRNFLKRSRKNDGVTAIEYGLIAAAIALAIIVTVASVGDTLDGTFGRVQSELAEHSAE